MAKDIHWFPGHMKKAQNEIDAKLKIVDCVIELLDSRIPFSSRNDYLYKLTSQKERLVVLTKADLADPLITSKWISFFKESGFHAIFADLNNPKDINKIILEAEKCGTKKHEKEISRGLKPSPVRAIIVGIPNVGKSTLINKIAKRKAAGVQNKPGHTKAQQWIKVSNKFELLDTPGILQSSYESKEKAINLALVGSINENILPSEELGSYLLDFLKEHYKDELVNRYNLSSTNSNEDIINQIAKNRGLLTKGGLDTSKAYLLLLNEFKNGVIGKCTIEQEPKNL